MRIKEEIKSEANSWNPTTGGVSIEFLTRLLLEVLLDVRDLLEAQAELEPQEDLIRCVTCEEHFKSEVGHLCAPLGRWIFGWDSMGSPKL